MSDRIVGINAVEVALWSGAGQRLLIRDGKLNSRQQAIVELAKSQGVEVVRDSGSTEHVDQGVVLEAKAVKFRTELELQRLIEEDQNSWLFLVLDGVTDPRNFGACLRSAASFGVDGVIVAKDKSAPLSEVAVKAASGGASITPVFQVTNLSRCLDKLKKAGIWVVGTSLGENSQSLPELDLTGSIALVMGAEGKGLRPKTQKNCDFLAQIPAPLTDLSLNVSVAAGICLYEATRQRSEV